MRANVLTEVEPLRHVSSKVGLRSSQGVPDRDKAADAEQDSGFADGF